jgi:hypothetical protein
MFTFHSNVALSKRPCDLLAMFLNTIDKITLGAQIWPLQLSSLHIIVYISQKPYFIRSPDSRYNVTESPKCMRTAVAAIFLSDSVSTSSFLRKSVVLRSQGWDDFRVTASFATSMQLFDNFIRFVVAGMH